MKRVLITGGSGMLGSSLSCVWRHRYQVFATGRTPMTVNVPPRYRPFDLRSSCYRDLINWASPDLIIHCAAETNVDYCELHPEDAFAVNADPLLKLAKQAPRVPIFFISSDAAIGEGFASEGNDTIPLNVYGQTKALAENFLRHAALGSSAIRTTIVGWSATRYRRGFADRILDALNQARPILLFVDVFFSPITIWQLANELEWLIESNAPALVHISGRTRLSKYEFGVMLASALEFSPTLIRPSLLRAAAGAPRAHDQTLDCRFYERLSGRSLPTATQVIEDLVQRLQSK